MRTVIILTKRCELRCPYCIVEKTGEDMPSAITDKAIDLALSSHDPLAEIHYFGGEPLLQKKELIRATEKAAGHAAKTQKKIAFILSTNCLGIDADFADWAAGRNFTFELSLDGNNPADNADPGSKPAVWRQAAKNAALILSRNIPCFATTVITPETIHRLYDNIRGIHEIGIQSVNISPATGIYWPAAAANKFAEQLWRLHPDFFANGKIKLLNLDNAAGEMLFNRELCVNCDGSIYAGNAFLFSPPAIARQLKMGHVNENSPAYIYTVKIPPASFYIENVFPGNITLSYYRMVKVFQSYRDYFHKQNPPSDAAGADSGPGATAAITDK